MGGGGALDSLLPCPFCAMGRPLASGEVLPLDAPCILARFCKAVTALTAFTPGPNLLPATGLAAGIVGEGASPNDAVSQTGVREPDVDAPEPGRGIPTGDGARDMFCPPICDALRPGAVVLAVTIEPERAGVLEREG